jgi:penicillin-binding protein activator
MKNLLVISILAIAATTISCGPKAFVKGKYDEDVNKENLLNDQWSETDMQNSVSAMVNSLVAHPTVAQARKVPVVIVTNLQNKTSEHIDTQSIMDMVRVELTKTGKVAFLDKEARKDIEEEYEYQNSGTVSQDTKKSRGEQVGADYMINGRMDSIVQEVGKDKTVYYKLTLNLTNIKTGMISWTDQKQMRKIYRKKTIGL